MKKSPLQIVGIQRPKNYKKVIDTDSVQGVKEKILNIKPPQSSRFPLTQETEVYNMTPNVSEGEAKKVRDKFDATYMQSINPINFKGANSENSKCWDGYVKKGTKPSPTRPGVTVNNCVKK